MGKTISIPYELSSGEASFVIDLSYNIDKTDDSQTISCVIDTLHKNIPTWLQLRKFEIKSLYSKGKYVPLFNENNNVRNLDVTLFIDKVYSDIMIREKNPFSLV